MAWRDPFDVQLGGPVLQSPDLVPADKPSLGTGFLENLAATRREMELVGNTNAGSERLRSAYAPLVSALEEAGESFGEVQGGGRGGRAHFLNPFDLPDTAGMGGTASRGQMRDAIFARIRQRRLADPRFLAGVPDSADAFDKASADKAAAELQKIRRVQAGATTSGAIGGFLGGVAGSFEDPVNVWTMPFGGASRTVVGAFARGALENMAVETLSQPFIAENYSELGEQMTIGDSVRQVLFAGGAGGAFNAGMKGIGKGLAHAGPAYDRFVGRVYEALPESVRDKWASGATVDDRTLADTIRATVPEAGWTPEQRDAVNVLEREAEIREASPFMPGPDGDQAHAQSLTVALQAAIAARAPRPSGPLGRASLMSSTASVGASDVRLNTAAPGGVPSDIVQFFLGKGYSSEQAHGIAAGIVAESRGNERIVNPDSGAAFLGQWLGSRKAELLRRYGPTPSRQQQLEFLHWELQGGDAGGKAVLAEKSASGVLDAYIRKFMRPAAGAETAGDLERGMEALGLEGAADSGAPARADLEDLGDANMEAELAARELDDAAEASAAAFDRPERPARPVLKRELFASDESWLDAQLRIWDDVDGETPRQAAGNGPPARDEGAGPAAGGEASPGAQRPSDEPGALTVQSYVDAYLRGEGRGETPRDRELLQFAANHGPEIENEFSRRRAMASSAPLSRDELAEIGSAATGETPDPLWYAGYNQLTTRELGRDPAPLWAVRDKRTGQVLTWSVKKQAAKAAAANLWDPEEHEVFELTPDMIWGALRGRLAERRVELANPAMDRFSDPEGDGVRAQVESLEHDLRAAIDADPEFGERLFAVADDDKPRTLLTILEELDAEDAAVEAMRACL